MPLGSARRAVGDHQRVDLLLVGGEQGHRAMQRGTEVGEKLGCIAVRQAVLTERRVDRRHERDAGVDEHAVEVEQHGVGAGQVHQLPAFRTL